MKNVDFHAWQYVRLKQPNKHIQSGQSRWRLMQKETVQGLRVDEVSYVSDYAEFGICSWKAGGRANGCRRSWLWEKSCLANIGLMTFW